MIWKTLLIVAVFAVATDTVVMASPPGGYSDASITDPGVQDALRYAVKTHNEGTNDRYLRRVAQVISVQQQVVSGMNYKFVVQMGKTACIKTGVQSNCPFLVGTQFYQCTFVVYEHWSGTVSLTSESCH